MFVDVVGVPLVHQFVEPFVLHRPGAGSAFHRRATWEFLLRQRHPPPPSGRLHLQPPVFLPSNSLCLNRPHHPHRPIHRVPRLKALQVPAPVDLSVFLPLLRRHLVHQPLRVPQHFPPFVLQHRHRVLPIVQTHFEKRRTGIQTVRHHLVETPAIITHHPLQAPHRERDLVLASSLHLHVQQNRPFSANPHRRHTPMVILDPVLFRHVDRPFQTVRTAPEKTGADLMPVHHHLPPPLFKRFPKRLVSFHLPDQFPTHHAQIFRLHTRRDPPHLIRFRQSSSYPPFGKPSPLMLLQRVETPHPRQQHHQEPTRHSRRLVLPLALARVAHLPDHLRQPIDPIRVLQ